MSPMLWSGGNKSSTRRFMPTLRSNGVRGAHSIHRARPNREELMQYFARLAIGALLLVSFGGPAAVAQDYPSRSVKIIVPFGAGGPADVYARVLAQHLTDTLKQPFVVENRPGAGAVIGTDAVAKSPPDGYTLLLMSNTHTTNESLIPNKPYALMKDLAPVATINYSDLLM